MLYKSNILLCFLLRIGALPDLKSNWWTVEVTSCFVRGKIAQLRFGQARCNVRFLRLSAWRSLTSAIALGKKRFSNVFYPAVLLRRGKYAQLRFGQARCNVRFLRLSAWRSLTSAIALGKKRFSNVFYSASPLLRFVALPLKPS